jgi:predicted NBD/HSP70 family sugar kinase
MRISDIRATTRGCWEVFGANRAALRYYLEKMAHFLGRGMRMIVARLDPEQIVIIGDLTRSWHRFGPVIQAEVRAQGLSGGGAPRLIPRLRGTLALSLQRHFGVSQEVTV